MSRPPAKTSDFLSKLNFQDDPTPEPANESAPIPPARTRAKAAATVVATAPRGRPPKRESGSRHGLKHIGGYVSDATAEQFALLKIRLRQGNDDLITAAIDALWRAEDTKRKFEG